MRCCNNGEVMSEKEQSQHATKRPFHVSSQPSELSDLENPCTHRNKAVQHHLASNVPYGLFPIFTVSVFGTRALQTCIYACICCSPCSKLKVFIWIKNTILFIWYVHIRGPKHKLNECQTNSFCFALHIHCLGKWCMRGTAAFQVLRFIKYIQNCGRNAFTSSMILFSVVPHFQDIHLQALKHFP